VACRQTQADPAPDLFSDRQLPDAHDLLAPDGSQVRLLPGLARGGMAHFRLLAGQVSRAVRHRTVEEIWYVLDGQGEIWRSLNGQETVTALSAGACLTIPVGTGFQFRAATAEAVSIVAVTMPPWPGEDEAIGIDGIWQVAL
jgi:mannose-6-phosphate isomerase-like protein (cupin superfamily)